jgi:hypothetical protein
MRGNAIAQGDGNHEFARLVKAEEHATHASREQTETATLRIRTPRAAP